MNSNQRKERPNKQRNQLHQHQENRNDEQPNQSFAIPPRMPPLQYQHQQTALSGRQRSTSGRFAVEGKDLIIRMLAEVFQVDQTDGCGSQQARWQQVSSSLVPVSLYSRTTSRWLNYLLATSNNNNSQKQRHHLREQQPDATTSSAMSPDSRDFLLLLQRFHQDAARQNQSQSKTQRAQCPDMEQQQQQQHQQPGTILFQVVAHDYFDGQCKKILNVKIAQPGTRLGQASDYFVYWKEPQQYSQVQPYQNICNNNNNNHQSFASTNRPSRSQTDQHQHHQHIINSAQSTHSPSYHADSINNNMPCCYYASDNPTSNWPQQQQQQQRQQHTWGLNFASVNDAKLFYAICSLNQVDLNFNSDYLKQLAASAGNSNSNDVRLASGTLAATTSGIREKQQDQKLIRDFLNYNNKQKRLLVDHNQQQQSASGSMEATNQRFLQHFCPSQESYHHQSGAHLFGASPSSSKCPSCRQHLQQQQQHVHHQSLADSPNCRLHHSHTADSLLRTCNIGARQPATSSAAGGSLRTRSRSAAASRRHEPATSAKLQMTTTALHDSCTGATTANKERRMRSFSTPASPERDPNCPVHQAAIEPSPVEHPAAAAGMHHHPRCLSSYYLQQQQQKQQQPMSSASQSLARPKKPARGLLRDSQSGESTTRQHSQQVASDRMEFTTSRFMSGEHQRQKLVTGDGNHSAQTGGGIGDCCTDEDDKAAEANRHASLARAQYAQSKNLKEFLSLDAGGQSATPTRLAALNQRFQQQLRESCQTGASQTAQQLGQRQGQASGSPLDGATDGDLCGGVKGAAAAAATISQLMGAEPQASVSSSSFGKRTANNAPSSANLQQQLAEGLAGPAVKNLAPAIAATTATTAMANTKNNASTTTDDLPLDPLIRRRMFKLTSEEVISERTEPASFATSQETGVVVGAPMSPASTTWLGSPVSTLPKQTRAVSLGPELEVAARELVTAVSQQQQTAANLEELSRGRSVRSDSGRRRSLERSMCVDLSTTVAAAATTTATASIASNDRCNNNIYCPRFTHQNNCTLREHRRREAAGAAGDSLPQAKQNDDDNDQRQSKHSTTTARRTRTRSSTNNNNNQTEFASSTPTSSRQVYGQQQPTYSNNNNYQCSCCQQRRTVGARQQLASELVIEQQPICASLLYKSAPDVSQLNCQPLDSYNHYLVPAAVVGAGRVAATNYQYYQHDSYWPQPPPPAQPIDDECVRSLTTTATAYAAPLCGEHSRRSTTNSHSCPNSLRRKRRQYPAPSPCDGRQCQVATPFYNNNNSLYLHQPTSIVQYHQPKSQSHCCTHLQQQQQQFKKPCNNLSSAGKSPLHYGLYESDGDNDYDDEGLMAEQCNDEQIPGNTCDECAARVYSQPTASAVAFRPVEGYDQTMARTSLKSRQRARSQPPRADSQATIAAAEQVAHLSKSMENVQKLIKEVQSELRALSNRQPLASAAPAQCLRHATLSPLVRQNLDTGAAAHELNEMCQEEQSGQIKRHQQHSRQVGSSSSTRNANQFRCVGAIRKAGFLSVKKWILKRNQSIELARKQGWKRYWVCLRGTALLFHTVIDKNLSSPDANNSSAEQDEQPTDLHDADEIIDLISWIQANCCCAESQNQMIKAANLLTTNQQQNSKQQQRCYIEKEPRHLIIVDGSIGQPIPEHPKRDFVFCLSTTFGDAYLFQASCQLESDNWISALHNACAASIARDLTRNEAVKFFEAKIRHLEMEAEKKLFLRVRLESRLNSMSSMSHISALVSAGDIASQHSDELENKRATMRSLLFKLQQQLLALDFYLEQVHCEIYQLRCYLSSCLNQHLFYLSAPSHDADNYLRNISPKQPAIDLPHPRTLLMHVSKPTKLLLIKLGVFTVSSLHAYINARQGSADTILLKIREQAEKIAVEPSLADAASKRYRSQSISDRLLGSNKQALELETDTEQLIELSDLRPVGIRVARELYDKLRACNSPLQSDDRYSFHNEDDDDGQNPLINLKLRPNSSAIDIIKQILSILQTYDSSALESEARRFYLRFQPIPTEGDKGAAECKAIYVAKRGETLADWSIFEYLEFAEKIVFKIQLTKGRSSDNNEQATPFGFAIGAQLLELGQAVGQQQLLDVYFSYIEWGGVADRAGLMDEDELLMINGVPVMDLDMMFIECIVQDDISLQLVVRSCRTEPPTNAILLDNFSWRSIGGNGDGDDNGNVGKGQDRQCPGANREMSSGNSSGAAKLITDEYISSLVCPPPPTRSKAFLRMDTSLLRQKSDLQASSSKASGEYLNGKGDDVDERPLRLVASATIPSLTGDSTIKFKATSQVELRADDRDDIAESELVDECDDSTKGRDCCAEQTATWDSALPSGTKDDGEITAVANEVQTDPNLIERMRKSILELLETEYAYIRHLETIVEHFLGPIAESNYLNIIDLEHLHLAVRQLCVFQRGFFVKLLANITSSYLAGENSRSADATSAIVISDESEELNKIVNQLDLFIDINQFKSTLRAIARIFLREADNFRVYSAYCVAYSRLQKFLHPNRLHRSAHSNIIPARPPLPLDTFASVSSQQPQTATTPTNVTQRDFFRPLSSFMSQNSNGYSGGHGNNNNNGNKNAVSNTSSNSSNSFSISSNNNNEQLDAQLKQLSKFLANLDSSSSSVSTSLPTKSSICSSIDHSQSDSQKRPSSIKSQASISAASSTVSAAAIAAATAATSGNHNQHSFQKSVNQQNFESYLIKPIQRIVRYPMLLNSIVQVYQYGAASAADDTDTTNNELLAATKQMSSITSHVNDAQRVQDEYGPTFETIERLFFTQNQDSKMVSNSLMSQPPINLAIENLLHFGPVDWLNLHEFCGTSSSTLSRATAKRNSLPPSTAANLNQMLFVFNSCVVFICKERVAGDAQGTCNGGSSNKLGGARQQSKVNQQIGGNNTSEIIRYQSIIPVCEVQVRSVTHSSSTSLKKYLAPCADSASIGYQWELFRCSSVNSNSNLLSKTQSANKRQSNGKVYLLASPTNEVRNAFLRKIRLIIRDSVRNMSLPLARSPSSKSLTPKKLSSPTSPPSSSSSASSATNNNSNNDLSCSHCEKT